MAAAAKTESDPSNNPGRTASQAELDLIAAEHLTAIRKAEAEVTHVVQIDNGLAITLSDTKTRKNLVTVHTRGTDADLQTVTDAAIAVTLIPNTLLAAIKKSGAEVIRVVQTDGGLAITLTDVKTRKNLDTVHTLRRDSDQQAVTEVALAVASRRPIEPKKAAPKTALNPKPAVSEEQLASVEKQYRDPITVAGLIIVEVKLEAKGPIITIADPEGRAEARINLGTGGEMDRLKERIAQVKRRAIAITKKNGVEVPASLAKLANRIGVQFDGAVEPFTDNRHLLVIQGKENPNIRMNFEYNPRKIDKPIRTEFLKRIRQVAARSKPKVPAAPKVTTRRPIAPAIVIPQAYYDEASKLNVSINPFRHRPVVASATVTPISITVEIDGKSSQHSGVGLGQRYDFPNNADGNISTDKENIDNFRTFCERVIRTAATELKARLTPAQISSPHFDTNRIKPEAPKAQLEALTRNNVPPFGFDLSPDGDLVLRTTSVIYDDTSAAAALEQITKQIDLWRETHAALTARAKTHRRLSAKKAGRYTLPVEVDTAPAEPAAQIRIPGVPWQYYVIAKRMNITIESRGTFGEAGSIPVVISDAPGFFATAGVGNERRTYRFLDGRMIKANFDIAPTVDGSRKSYRQNLTSFLRDVSSLAAKVQEIRQNAVNNAIKSSAGFVQGAERIQDKEKLHQFVPLFRRNRNAKPAQKRIPEVSWHYYAIASGMKITITANGGPAPDGSIPVTISDGPDFIAAAGKDSDQKTYRFREGGRVKATVNILPLVEGGRINSRQDLANFFRAARDLVTQMQEIRQQEIKRAIQVGAPIIVQGAEAITDTEKLRKYSMPFRRNRNPASQSAEALNAA